MAIEIKEVQSTEELKRFVLFGNELYKSNPYHVPVLIKDEMETLDRDINPAFEFCESIYFLAYRDGQIVGRIAGIINHRANEAWNQQHARFGFVDFINDNEVVDALFDAVSRWAKNKGMDMLHGPMGFTDMDKEGMLVEGFDHMSTMITIYNYAYYPKQLERIGFIKDQDWKEYLITIPDSIPEKHVRIARLVEQKYGISVLKIKKSKDLVPYGPVVFDLINKCYANLYGFSQLSDRQIEYYSKMYMPLLRPDFVTLIKREADHKIIGFGVALPNLSNALRKANGKLYPLGFIPLLRALKGRPQVIDLYLMGVLPEYQNRGVNALIFNDLIPYFRNSGAKYAESNPELETNMSVQLQWNYFERKHHKTRRAYIKPL